MHTHKHTSYNCDGYPLRHRAVLEAVCILYLFLTFIVVRFSVLW